MITDAKKRKHSFTPLRLPMSLFHFNTLKWNYIMSLFYHHNEIDHKPRQVQWTRTTSLETIQSRYFQQHDQLSAHLTTTATLMLASLYFMCKKQYYNINNGIKYESTNSDSLTGTDTKFRYTDHFHVITISLNNILAYMRRNESTSYDGFLSN